MVTYLLKNHATDEALTEYEAAILRYMQPSNITLQQYADDLVAESCMVADTYHKRSVNDAFTEGVDASILHSLRHFCAQDAQVNLADNASLTDSVVREQKVTDNVLNDSRSNYNLGKAFNQKTSEKLQYGKQR